MISVDRPPVWLGRVAALPDHADAAVLHVLPGELRFAERPSLDLYRSLEGEGWGELGLTLETAPPEGAVPEAPAGARPRPAFFHAAEARASLFGEAARPAAAPEVTAPHTARFHAKLPAHFATMAREAIVVGAVYELRCLAFGPDLGAVAVLDAGRVRQALAAAPTPITHAGIVSLVDQLQADGAIRLQLRAAPAPRLRELLVERFRSAFLRAVGHAPETPGGESLADALGAARATFEARPADATAAGTVQWRFDGLEAVELTWVTAGHVTAPGPDVREHDLAGTQPLAITIHPVGLDRVEALREVAVRLEHRGRAEERTFAPDATEPVQVEWPLDPFDTRSYEWSAELRFADGRPPLRSAPETADHMMLILAPECAIDLRTVELVWAPWSPSPTTVEVACGDGPAKAVELGEQRPQTMCRFQGPRGTLQSCRAAERWTDAAGAAQSSPWQELESDIYLTRARC